MSSPSRPQRKSRNVPPMRLMDDLMEYYPPVATSGMMEIKEEQCSTEDVSPTKKRKVSTPEKQTADMPINPRIEYGGPKKSYADIIREALLLSDDNIMSVGEIYDFVWDKYPRKTTSVRWKDTLRRTLSRDGQFHMISGQGQFWSIRPDASQDPLSGGNQEKPGDDKLEVNQEELEEKGENRMAKRSGRVELDAINEDDFDLDMDISNEQGTVGSDPAPEAAHLQQPVFQRVVVLPAGSVAQLKIQKILEAGNAPILIPKSNPTPKEVVKREICDKCGKDLSKLKKSRDHKRYCGKVGPICPICGKQLSANNPRLERHTKNCDPVGSICKRNHEHQILDKVFATFEEAMAHFYDNEYDSEFRSGSIQYKDRSRKTSVPSGTDDKSLVFLCNRSGTKYKYETKKPRISRKMDEKCTAKITINKSTNALNGEQVTRVYGCMAHNHPNNPTMKRTSWLTKRKIAKFLLLGHSRKDIRDKLMPPFQIEGQKTVDLEVVNRVQRKMSEDKHHKLREGHDIASLLGKDGSGGQERRVYPWPTQTNCPVRNAQRVEHYRKKTEKLSAYNKNKGARKALSSSDNMKISSPLVSLEEQEVERAISSIADNVGGETNLDSVDHSTDANHVEDGDVVLAEPTNDFHAEVPVAAANTDTVITNPVTLPDRDSTLSDDAIDPQAFETLRQKALRLTERLTPTISGLPATGAGMAELRTILKSSLFDLMCDDLDPTQERPQPKPGSRKTYESYKRRVAEGRTIPKNYKRPTRIPDEKLLTNL